MREAESEWERRKRIPPDDEYRKWTRMNEEEMIKTLKETEAKEAGGMETKREKAARRKQYWKEWRKKDIDDDEIEPENEVISDKKDKMKEYIEMNQEVKRRVKDWKEKQEAWRTSETSVSKYLKTPKSQEIRKLNKV